MSLLRYMFDNDLAQRHDIEALGSKARRNQRKNRRHRSETRDRIEDLEDQVGELSLVCEALLRVLKDSGRLDPTQLQAALEQIDAEDGVIDGKVTREEDRPQVPKPIDAPTRSKRSR